MREISKEEYIQELEDLKVERSHYCVKMTLMEKASY